MPQPATPQQMDGLQNDTASLPRNGPFLSLSLPPGNQRKIYEARQHKRAQGLAKIPGPGCCLPTPSGHGFPSLPAGPANVWPGQATVDDWTQVGSWESQDLATLPLIPTHPQGSLISHSGGRRQRYILKRAMIGKPSACSCFRRLLARLPLRNLCKTLPEFKCHIIHYCASIISN